MWLYTKVYLPLEGTLKKITFPGDQILPLCAPPGQSHLSSLPWTGAEPVDAVNNIKKRLRSLLMAIGNFSKQKFIQFNDSLLLCFSGAVHCPGSCALISRGMHEIFCVSSVNYQNPKWEISIDFFHVLDQIKIVWRCLFLLKINYFCGFEVILPPPSFLWKIRWT